MILPEDVVRKLCCDDKFFVVRFIISFSKNSQFSCLQSILLFYKKDRKRKERKKRRTGQGRERKGREIFMECCGQRRSGTNHPSAHVLSSSSKAW